MSRGHLEDDVIELKELSKGIHADKPKSQSYDASALESTGGLDEFDTLPKVAAGVPFAAWFIVVQYDDDDVNDNVHLNFSLIYLFYFF